MEKSFLPMGGMSQETGALGDAKCHCRAQEQQRLIAFVNERQWEDGNPGGCITKAASIPMGVTVSHLMPCPWPRVWSHDLKKI